MRKVDYNCHYDKSCNFWIRNQEGSLILGLSDWGQYLIGDISQVLDFPEIGRIIEKDNVLCVLESHKATNDIIMPLTAEIIAVNKQLIKNPTLINSDCYGQGWIIKIAKVDEGDLNSWDSGEIYKSEIDNLFRK